MKPRQLTNQDIDAIVARAVKRAIANARRPTKAKLDALITKGVNSARRKYGLPPLVDIDVEAWVKEQVELHDAYVAAIKSGTPIKRAPYLKSTEAQHD